MAADTTVIFTVTSGSLGISVPASVSLVSAAPGGNATAQLGMVTVTDDRAAVSTAWTATVDTTDFTTGGGTGPETVAKADVSYWSGAATATAGVGTFTPGQANSAAEQSLGTTRTVFTLSSGTGNNSATWNPTLDIAIPSGAVGGIYTGTVTHSVA